MERNELGLTEKQLRQMKEDVTDPEVEKEIEKILREQSQESDVAEAFQETVKELTDESKEKMKTLDLGKLWKQYGKWVEQDTTVVSKGEYIFRMCTHAFLTLITGGLWFLGMVGYYVYLFKKDLERRDADIHTEWEKNEE